MLQWLIGLSLLSLPFWWGEPVTWELEAATPLAEIADIDSRLFNAILAPDGSAFAWEEASATCVYRFADDATACYEWPENARLRSSRVNLPTWSPDGRYIAQTENLLQMFTDSDVWVLDTQAGTWTDRTDDGHFGSAMMSSSVPDNLPLDYLPTWNPATNELYFFRSQEREPVLVDVGYTLQLYKMGAAAGEPELVRDLTLALPGPMSVYRPVVFSDDGTKLALLALPANLNDSPGAGVWVLDLANNDTDLVAPLARFAGILPDWASERYIPMSLQWAGNDLVVWLEDAQFGAGITRTPVYLDVDTGVATPLVDFSQFDSAPDYFNARTAERAVHDNAIVGTVLPGGSAYWLIVSNNSEELMGVFELSLPGSDGEPRLVTTIPQQLAPGQDALPTMSDDGKLLMLHTLFTLREAEADE